MTVATPWMLLGLALLVPVTIAFLVRRRREIVRVPSIFLFRAARAARARTRRFRELMRLLCLAACLLATAALVVGAARPTTGSSGETIAAVVDLSASMGDGSRGTPLAEARRYLSSRIAMRGPEDRFVIVAARREPERLVGPTDSGPRLEAALEGLEPTREAADLGAALELAAALVAQSSRPRVLLIHDGGAGLGPPGAGALRGVLLRQRLLGFDGAHNVGITAFATRPPTNADDDDQREALVAVASSAPRERRVEIVVEANGLPLARQELAIPPEGEEEVRVRLRTPSRHLVARVRPVDGGGDALSQDDEAVVDDRGPHRPPRALLVAPGPEHEDPSVFFVEEALHAAGASEVVRTTPARAAETLIEGDVAVVLSKAPPVPLDAPTLFVATAEGPLPIGTPRRLGEDDRSTRLKSVAEGHPLLRGVDLDGLAVRSALVAERPEAGRTLVELDGGAAVLSGGAGRTAWIYTGIDPGHSDLVLRVAFPVLVANALAVLGQSTPVISAETVPRSEVTLRRGPELEALDAPEATWSLPASPVFVLVLFAATLMCLELLSWRRGWSR